jgi:deazaflavin-dependent oxidoreductase (nitroreductase family)
MTLGMGSRKDPHRLGVTRGLRNPRGDVDVTAPNDWNAKVIAEFRANDGRVGGAFEGAPIALVHHRGRSSGRDYVSPMMYLADEGDAATIYVFGSKAGAPTHPDWYYNLKSAGLACVEVGTDTYQVTVSELEGEEWPRFRGAGAPLPRLREVRREGGWHPHDPSSRASARVSKSLGSTSAPGVLGCMPQLGDIAGGSRTGSEKFGEHRGSPRGATGLDGQVRHVS